LSRKCGFGVGLGVLVKGEGEEREKKEQNIEKVVKRMVGEKLEEVERISERRRRGG
jgi:hypothetical protein